ncbi:MAG: HAMP domain-containing protein, partial [Actinomycetota bacterium]|nr:HAMP domain-containing protein [Actinomycetota bacterium]
MAVFAVGSSILLVLTGALLYVGFNGQLNNAIEQALRDRAADIELDLREGSQQIRPGEPFVVLLETNGQVIDSTVTGVGRTPVLTARELARAQEKEVVVERRKITGLGDRGKLLARPEKLPNGQTIVLVVGESLETVSRASERLGILLAVTSPVLIGIIVGCGWVLVGAALRPVRRMTAEAESISLRESGQRLAEPPGDDEIALLGHTLNAMLDRIEASLAHERAFVDDASHELRTPLSILRGELELASTAPEDRAGMARALSSALQEADRLGRLTDDLLVLARSDRGHLAPRLAPVELLESARRPVERRSDATMGVGVTLTGDPVTVSADPALLERVLGNLIDNACRHAATRVELSVGVDSGAGRLVVADDGPGFPPEFLPVAFDRFTRADAVRGRDEGGSG